MNSTPMSEEALLSGLRDIRLPSEAAGGVLSETLASFGLACFAALCVLVLIRSFHLVRPGPRPPSVEDELTRISGLPPTEKRIALLKLLRRHAPERYAVLSERLYQPGGASLSALEAELHDHV